jgi:hypothetical protein
MSGSLLSDKQLNRLVTQKTNKSGNNGIIGTWTTQSPNPIKPFYPETGDYSYTKLELTEDKLSLIISFNSDYSNPNSYINRDYKLVDNTIQINIASEDGMYLNPGYPIPNVSPPGSTGSGFYKFVERTFIFTPSSNKVYFTSKYNLADQNELKLFKVALTDSGNWNIYDTSAEYIIELNKTM